MKRTPLLKNRCYNCWAPITKRAELNPRCKACTVTPGRKALPQGAVPLPKAPGYEAGLAGNRR